MIERILSLFFPKRCPYCREVMASGLTECEKCRKEFPKVPKKMTLRSGILCTAPFAYDGKVRESVILYKFKGLKFNADSYAKAVCNAIVYEQMKDSFDIITYVPLTAVRRKERGFNQSELIARKVAAYFEKECVPLLKKVRTNKNQHDLSVMERENNVKGVFGVCSEERITGKNILLFDDVATTGYTMQECCAKLYEHGAKSVQCMSIAIAGAV